MRPICLRLTMVLIFIAQFKSVDSQTIEFIETDISSELLMLRVSGITSLGYIDRIVETVAETDSDTAKVELFFDWCALSGVFEVYDTTFVLESIFPFDLCVTVYRDTLALDSPCDAYNFEIDTGETVCLTADQILSTEMIWQQNQLKLYPNPTERYLTLETIGLPAREIMYSVRDINGREVLNGQTVSKSHLLDVGSLYMGIFILELRWEKGVLRRRFVKSR